MALVVTAPPAVEAQPCLGESPLASSGVQRLRRAVRWYAVASCGVYATSLVVEASARFAAPGSVAAIVADGVGAVALVAAFIVAIGAWVARRRDGSLLLAATLAAVLAAVRPIANALLLSLDQATSADGLDVGLGLLALGGLVWAATAWFAPAGMPARPRGSAGTEMFDRVAEVTSVLILGTAVTGAIVRAVGASWACQGVFPDCNGLGPLPFGREPLADIQLYHRLLAYVSLALVIWLLGDAVRGRRGVIAPAIVLFGSAAAQAAIGVASVASVNPVVTQALHTAGAAATWSAAVVVVVRARRSPSVGATFAARGALGRTLSAYVQLTKPRVMSLLLATTATAMIIAARGMPDLGVLIATLVGGALMSGGAGAINHYVDRDIDPLMGRTAWRPIPSGVIAPRDALWFGIGLAVLASAVFLLFVNPLAWVLAVLGLLGYVFIYTLWLKRSTPSNIVIGGAAGAIPPLVGWAAVTNEISSLTAWYLFAIIFFWTPPHFWALSLLIRQHYARAGVPMLPVVRGEDETRRQIVLYALLLVVLSLVLSPFGMMGLLYFAAALVLGGLFIGGAVHLWRRGTREAARGLYLYSILYLFALFTAMAVDRVISV